MPKKSKGKAMTDFPLPLTPEYRRMLAQAAEAAPRGRAAEIARELKMPPKTIHVLIKGKVRSSRYLAAVAERFGLPPPVFQVSSPLDVEWLEVGIRLRAVSPDEYKKILDRAKRTADLADVMRSTQQQLQELNEDPLGELPDQGGAVRARELPSAHGEKGDQKKRELAGSGVGAREAQRTDLPKSEGPPPRDRGARKDHR